MEPIPRSLSRRLALTFLVGAGCFFIGLAFFFREKDMIFFFLSSFIFVFSCIRMISLFLKVRGKSYTVLEGICTGLGPRLFGKYREICLMDVEGVSHTLSISKDYKIRTGRSYRFYFLSSPDSFKGDSHWLNKAMLADSLFGIELLEDAPESGTVSSFNVIYQ